MVNCHPRSQRIAYLVSYSLVLLLSIVGNAYIIAIVLRNKEMHSTVNYLIVNMALSDIVGSIVSLSIGLSIFATLSTEWRVKGTLGNILCKAHPFLRDVCITVSILSNVAIALDRFFAVVFPMKPIPRFLKNRIVLPAIWLVATAGFAIYLYTMKLSPFLDVFQCIMKWPANVDPNKAGNTLYLSIVVGGFIAPCFVITSLYLAIACSLKRGQKRQQSADIEKRRRKENIAITKMLFTIAACFFACWFPSHILTFLGYFVWKGAIPAAIAPFYEVLEDCSTIFSYVSFFINPLICFTFNGNYRQYLKKTFPFNLCCGNRT